MKIIINAVHFTADDSLIDFIHRKLGKVETFYDRILSATVFLKLDKGEKSTIQKKVIEINVAVPGQTIFIKEEGTSFEEATDIAVDVLSRNIKKHKQKTAGIDRRRSDILVQEEEA